MPTLKVKPEFVTKLKALGCYDVWRANLIAQWHTATDVTSIGKTIDELQICSRVDFLINYSFCFSDTPEGTEFWWNLIRQIK